MAAISVTFVVVTPVWATFGSPLLSTPVPRGDGAVDDTPVPGELVDIWGWRVVVVAGCLGVVLVEIKMDEDAVTKPLPSTATVPTSQKSEPLHLRDSARISRPCPERQIPCVFFASRARLDVVE